MEENKKRFYELCGLPGSGKTFILEKNFDKEDYVLEKEFFSNIKDISNVKKLKMIFNFFPKNAKIIYYIFLYSITLKKNKRYALVRAMELIKFLVYTKEILEKIDFKEKIIILDQGIIQCLWSISSKNYNQNAFNRKILCKIVKCIDEKFDFYSIKIVNDLEKIVEQVTKRNSNCIFDHMEKEKVRKYYEKTGDYFDLMLDERVYSKNLKVNIDQANTQIKAFISRR